MQTLLKICTALNYDQNGEKRRVWRKVGELFNNDSGQMFIRFYHQPETCFYVFHTDEKPKVEIAQKAGQRPE